MKIKKYKATNCKNEKMTRCFGSIRWMFYYLCSHIWI